MKYIKFEELDVIISEFKQEAYYDMVNCDRLAQQLSKVKGVVIPRVNNIAQSIQAMEKAAGTQIEMVNVITNGNGESETIHANWARLDELMYTPVTEIKKHSTISRPTLTKWRKTINSLKGRPLRCNCDVGDYVSFLRELKIEQEK